MLFYTTCLFQSKMFQFNTFHSVRSYTIKGPVSKSTRHISAQENVLVNILDYNEVSIQLSLGLLIASYVYVMHAICLL